MGESNKRQFWRGMGQTWTCGEVQAKEGTVVRSPAFYDTEGSPKQSTQRLRAVATNCTASIASGDAS